jgi:hypothetical protein
VAKILRHRSWIMQEDGSYKPMDVPGPESFEVWDACFKVYEVILLMLRYPRGEVAEAGLVLNAEKEMMESLVVTPFAVEAYHEAFAALSREHPECWHLCQRAEDRCRAEHFPRLARSLRAKSGKDPSWSDVFIAAAEDDRYWDREVRRPALTFLARGRRVQDAGEPSEKRIGNGSRKRARSPDVPKIPVDAPSGGRKKKGKGGGKGRGKGGDHPRKGSNGRFHTTREGVEICYNFANGDRNACKDPCSNGRAHVCQHCLQPHSNAACTKRN